jgi:hypothetical protein
MGTCSPAALSSAASFQWTSCSTAWKKTLAPGATPAGTGVSPASIADRPSPSTEPVTCVP